MLLKKVCTYNVSSVQCVYVYMCVCACSYVCIILALTRVKGLGTKVGCVNFIKHGPPFCIWKWSGDKPSVESSRMLGVQHCYCRKWM